MALSEDITERKRAEEELRKSEQRWRALFHTLQQAQRIGRMGSWYRDLKSNMFTCSEQFWRNLGMEPKTQPATYDEIERLLAPESVRQILLANQCFIYSSEGADEGADLEVEIRPPDGSTRWGVLHREVDRDHAGNAIGIRGIVQDITERKRAEELLRDREGRFRAIFENAGLGMALVDRQGHPIKCNPALLKMLGYSENELRNMVFTEFTHPDDISLDWGLYNEVVAGKRDRYEIDKRYIRKDGRLMWGHLTCSLLKNKDGAPADSMVGMVEDITERKQAELALREAQAELARITRIATMGELTASIAHEINQPLGAVVTNGNAALRWLAGQPANLDEVRQALKRTIREANRASDVIGRIRALLQKTPPQTERLDINAVIREVVTLANSELLRGGVAVQLELAPDVPTVLGDRVQLRQVLLNLILNAIDAMSTVTDRPRKLVIRSAQHQEGVLIQVQDSGTGLDPEQVDRIFEPFFTTKPEGIGMGLAIGRSIVEAHGGRLWATSASSHGAVFQFTLPRAVHERAA